MALGKLCTVGSALLLTDRLSEYLCFYITTRFFKNVVPSVVLSFRDSKAFYSRRFRKMSVRLSAWNNSAPTVRIFMKNGV